MGEPPGSSPSDFEGTDLARIGTAALGKTLDVPALAEAVHEFSNREPGADSPQVLGKFLRQIGDALHASCAALCLLSAERTHADLILVYGTPPPASHLGSPPFHEFGEPWPGVRATEGPPPDVLAYVCAQPLPVAGVAGVAGIPQVSGEWGAVASCIGGVIPGAGGPRGAIFLGRAPDAAPFAPEVAAVVSSLGSVIALYAQYARLRRASDQQTHREGSLTEVAAACIEASDPPPYALAQQTVCDILKADAVEIWVTRDGARSLRLVASRHIPEGRVGMFVPSAANASLPGYALASRKFLQVPNLSTERRFPAGDNILNAGMGSAAAAPLVAAGAPFGAMCAYFRGHVEVSDADTRYLQSVADLLAGALARRRAETERRHNEAVLQDVITRSPVPLIVYDDHERMVASSDLIWEITGHDPSDVHDLSDWFLLAHPDEVQRYRVRSALDCVQREAKDVRAVGDFEISCADESTRHWKLVLNPVTRDDEHPLYFMAGLDITEERRAQSHLRQAQKLEAVGRLAGGIAHDFNNLLTVISGYVDIAIGKLAEDHAARPPLAEVALAADRASQLTERLLAFSRRQSLDPEPLDLNELVRSLLGLMRRLIGESIEWKLQLRHPLPLVRADHAGLEQVLINLVLNARDAMEDTGSIAIGSQPVPAGSAPPLVGGPPLDVDHVMLSVSDTGCGMPPEIMRRVFEPFFTTKERGAGTGLGLANAYATVRQSEGDIRATSEVGKGTTFGVLLPATAEDRRSVAPIESGAPRRGTETVLIAEDRRPIRDLARATLEDLGYTVLSAVDGIAALEVAASHEGRIDLLVTDVIMPRMGGARLAEKLRDARPGLKVLFASGYPGTEFPHAKSPAHDEAVLRKPFTSSELGRRVRAALDDGEPVA